MNKPFSAKCYSRILSDLRQFSSKMRRSRKLSCKKGGVDCRVSRRERDFPNTFGVVIVRSSLYRNPRSLLLDGNKLSLPNQKDSVRGDLAEDVRRVPDLLKQGRTMLSDICP